MAPSPRSWAHRRALAVAAVTALTAALIGIALAPTAEAGTVGAGSYLDTLPAGRSLPTGCGSLSTNPRLYATSNAPAGGVPTNDWWSSLLFKKFDCAYSEPLHAHPISYDTFAGGLGFSYNTTAAISGTPTGVGEYHYPYVQDILVGPAGLNSPDTKVDGWSDWTVTPYWSDGARTMKATIGHGLPFAYFQITGGNARIAAVATPSVWLNANGQIGFTVNGRDYVAYAPTGSTWTVSGTTVTSTLNGLGFFSVAVLPAGADRAALASTYGQYAHAHVTGTRVSYSYNPATSTLNTTYTFTTTPRQGTQTATVAALYPHQWNALTGATPIANAYTTARGQMKILTGISAFTTSMKYTGVLPEIPAVADSSGADLTTLTNYLNAVASNPADFRGDDTYWTGKGLGRAARIAEIADQIGLTSVRDTALATIRTRLNDWFTASAGKTSRVFYYNNAWGTLLGYPASYGSDQELNDHHFHYGYFVAAAATLAKFDPAWASAGQYGGMVDLLIRDANNYDRSDTRFPYLRDFDIYAGHDWAAGHGAFGAGNNQESSSEGMNFANALIQFGQATGNTALRDAGIYIYTTQSAAIAEYWFDVRNQNFPSTFGHNTVGMVWGDGGAYATWFSGEPEMIQGINMLPVTGGHFYLGNDPAYVQTNYNELVTNNGGAPTVWQDILWEFLALGNGQAALNNFTANPSFTSEEGESKAHTFHWIRNLAALGTVDTTVTGNHPLAKVFSKSGVRTYVASNIGSSAITVTFSNGTTLNVPACKTVTSGAFTWTGGNACGGTNPSPSTQPSASPPPSSPPPSSSPSPSPSPLPSSSPGTFAATRYLASGGALPGTPATAATVSVSAANGNFDGTPHNPQVFTAGGLNATPNGGATNFDMFVDAGSGVGNATQVRVSYDFTGNGSWDRLETYNYFPTDPVAGYEHYTQAAGVKTTTGSFAALANGSVRVEIWSAIGNGATTLGIGNQSRIVLPYTGTTQQPSVNVALNKPTLVSSTENATFPGSQAVDGNGSTRWSSAFSDPQWIRVDLGQPYSISRVRLVWEAAYGSAYQIQTSPDGNAWTTVRTVTGGDGGVDDLTGLSGSGRYVRVYGTTRATPWGYSLFELEVYAP